MNEEIVPERVDIDSTKCNSCGSNLTFDPETGTLKCAYCGNVQELNGVISDVEYDFDTAEDEEITWNDETVLVHCKNCGANNIFEKDVISTLCPFCQTPLTVVETELPGVKPHRVVPFKLSKDGSLTAYKKWLKSKLLAPRKVKKEIPSPQLNGVYLPAWTYDADTYASYSGRLGKRHTRTVGTGKNRRTETYIKWYNISGDISQFFDDVVVCASEKVKQEDLNNILPFTTNDSFLYDSKYLSGFSAEHYNVNVKDSFVSAKNGIDEALRSLILSRYSYDVVGSLYFKPVYSNIKYKYVILPIWICQYSYAKKQYNYVVNGETGKVTGNYPKSALKIALISIFVIAFIILILYFSSKN